MFGYRATKKETKIQYLPGLKKKGGCLNNSSLNGTGNRGYVLRIFAGRHNDIRINGNFIIQCTETGC